MVQMGSEPHRGGLEGELVRSVETADSDKVNGEEEEPGNNGG